MMGGGLGGAPARCETPKAARRPRLRGADDGAHRRAATSRRGDERHAERGTRGGTERVGGAAPRQELCVGGARGGGEHSADGAGRREEGSGGGGEGVHVAGAGVARRCGATNGDGEARYVLRVGVGEGRT